MSRCHTLLSPSSEEVHSQLIEDWLQTVLDADHDNEAPGSKRQALTHRRINRKRAAIRMSSPPSTRRTLSPTKRRRIREAEPEEGEGPGGGGGQRRNLGNHYDAATPRANRLVPERIRSDLLHTPTASDKASASVSDGRDRGTLSDTSSMSKRSGRSSPTKREAAMRNANDLPLQRIPLKELVTLPFVDPTTISLVKDLSAIRQKIGILPGELKALFESQETIDDPLNDAMFAQPATATSGSSNSPNTDLVFQHRRLLRVCRSTVDCNNPARPVQEAEWNDKVHSSILELALDGSGSAADVGESLVFHNVTDARIATPFRDQSALLKDNMVDYGIFLAPFPASPLGNQISSFVGSSRLFTQLNALESFEVDRPLAVAIETKRTRGGDANAPSQLATFARAHFRLTRYLFHASKQIPSGDKEVGTAPQPMDSSLMLPLIEVNGPSWRISFAVLDADQVLVSSDLAIGSTDQMSDCYVLLQSLRRLAKWADSDCVAWWAERIGAISQGWEKPEEV